MPATDSAAPAILLVDDEGCIRESVSRVRDAPPRSPSLLRRPLLISIRFVSSRLEHLMAARQPIAQDAVHADRPLAGAWR
jgi:hypothetical protein